MTPPPPSLRVSRETLRRLEIYVAELTRWQTAVNLVSKRSLADIWSRHVDDSLQLVELAPGARTWVDLGAGAGLPGLVVAAADHAPVVTLVESDSRKCAFLRHATRAMEVAGIVREGRIETELAKLDAHPDIVTARGLAALPRLLDYAAPLLSRGSVGLFLKGDNFAHELTLARECWSFDVDAIQSRTDSTGRILRITNFGGRRA